ncbi:MAG: alpha/beta fold hydrolase, partial [Pseudomonadota bacterium]
MSDTSPQIADALPQKPPLRSVLREARLAQDAAHFAHAWWRLPSRPKGNGRSVLLLPGFGTDGTSMGALSVYLRRLGFRPKGWRLGTNRGNVEELMPLVEARVEEVASKAGGPIDLVGWSLGGFLARETARDRPDLVRRIVTLASPVVGGPKYTVLNGHYERRGADLNAIEAEIEERTRVPLITPVTALYTKSDGIVDWRACIDRLSPNVEHIEVKASHLGIGNRVDA